MFWNYSFDFWVSARGQQVVGDSVCSSSWARTTLPSGVACCLPCAPKLRWLCCRSSSADAHVHQRWVNPPCELLHLHHQLAVWQRRQPRQQSPVALAASTAPPLQVVAGIRSVYHSQRLVSIGIHAIASRYRSSGTSIRSYWLLLLICIFLLSLSEAPKREHVVEAFKETATYVCQSGKGGIYNLPQTFTI